MTAVCLVIVNVLTAVIISRSIPAGSIRALSGFRKIFQGWSKRFVVLYSGSTQVDGKLTRSQQIAKADP